MANYFGPDYVAFFGGQRKFEQAGFRSVVAHDLGVCARLVNEGCTREEFCVRQSQVEHRLAFDPRVFDEGSIGPTPELFSETKFLLKRG